MKAIAMKTAAAVLAAAMTISCAPAAYAAKYGWQGAEGASPYYQVDNTFASGVMVIDGIAYSFGPDGACRGTYTGFGMKNERRRYYTNGVPYNNGWLELPSGTYYFYSNGTAAEGIVTIDGKQYNFASDGRLIKEESRSSYTVTADKTRVYLGKNDSINFTVTANNISTSATLRDDIMLQQYIGGEWYEVKPNVLNDFTVTDQLQALHIIGNVGAPEYYRSSHTINFRPDQYSTKLTTGKYRAVITIMTDSSVVSKTCEFEIIQPVAVSSPSLVYNINSTDKIYFTTALNTDADVYGPEIYDLYFYDTDSAKWIKQEPKDGEDIIADTFYAKSGSIVNSYLDLTRYSRSSMKSGKYRVILGKNIKFDFELKTPFDVSVVQTSTSSPRNKQVKITVSNKNDYDITVSGYGELLRYEGGKWKKLPLKKNAKLDTKMEIPSMHKWSKTMLLTDYYSLSNLKKGNYCMKFPVSGGGFVYAYFTIS